MPLALVTLGGGRFTWALLRVPGSFGARESTCSEVPPLGSCLKIQKKKEEPFKDNKKVQEIDVDGQCQKEKKDGTFKKTEEATFTQRKFEGSSVVKISKGQGLTRKGQKNPEVAKKTWKNLKCWLTVWLWLSFVSPVRSSVVGVASWSAFKPGSPSLVPPVSGATPCNGVVELGAGKGAQNMPGVELVGVSCSAALLHSGCFEMLGLAVSSLSWFLGMWIVLLTEPPKGLLGSLSSLGYFLDWFFPRNPLPQKPIWSARLVKGRRVRGTRKGWKHRLHERCRVVDSVSRIFHSTDHSGSLQCKNLSSNHLKSDLGLPDVSWFHLGACRGGAKGTSGGKSKQNSIESELLVGLQKLLQQFNPQTLSGESKKGKGFGSGVFSNTDKGTPKLGTDVGLLQALKRLVTRAEKKPQGLLNRLQSLVVAAGKACEKGQTLDPKQKPGKTRRPGAGNSGLDGKGSGKNSVPKGAAKSQDLSEAPSAEGEWSVVGKKGRPQPPLLFPSKQIDFRLRESDWPGYTIVPRVQKLGAFLDSEKKNDPLVILVFSPQELVNLMQMIHGEKGVKITVLCPCKKGETISVDGFPNVTFEEKRYPVQDSAGKVLTKIMACWTNGVAFNQHMRVVVPQDRRPTNKPEFRNEHTTVIRLRADSRYCNDKVWGSAKNQPGAAARKWVAGVSPNSILGVLDSWGWELEPGSGKGSIIKGLIRIKKGQSCEDLLNASGRFSAGVRFFLEPLKWEETPVKKPPFISWVEQGAGEPDFEYASRVSKMATLGVAKGWKQLGLRSVTQADPSPPVSKAWVLRSAPRYWSMEQVESFLKAADFHEVSFTAKKWEKFGTSWCFRAVRDGPQDYLQLLYEGTDFETESRFVVVERELRLPKRNQVVPLKPKRNVPLRNGFWKNDKIRGTVGFDSGVAPTQLDATSEQADNEPEHHTDKDEKMDGENVKRSAGPGGSPEKKRAKAAPLPSGVEKVPNDGQGNCLFLAISQAIENAGGGSHNHRSVRAAAVTHLRKHAKNMLYFGMVCNQMV